MHDIAGVALTIATILAASFLNTQAVNNLRAEMRSEIGNLRSEAHGQRAEILGKLDAIQRDMRDLYAEQGRHDLRISNLEENQK